jgi:hypothetical protein
VLCRFASGGPLFEKSGAKTFPKGTSCHLDAERRLALIKSFLGVQGAIFQKSPLAAGGKKIVNK